MKAQVTIYTFETDTHHAPTIEYFGTRELADKARNEFLLEQYNENLNEGDNQTEPLTEEQEAKILQDGNEKGYIFSATTGQLWLDANVDQFLFKDYFQHVEETPKAVQDVLKKTAENAAEEDSLTYAELAQMCKDMEEIGWTFEYYLDAIPFNLRPILPQEDMLHELISNSASYIEDLQTGLEDGTYTDGQERVDKMKDFDGTEFVKSFAKDHILLKNIKELAEKCLKDEFSFGDFGMQVSTLISKNKL